MPIVTLPLGYPLLQGLEFESVVFEGTMARSYSVPVDPRTNSQLFARELFSDVAKMRASAGTWARGVWRVAFGSKASTIILQMARGDVDALWSSAVEEWESFDGATKAYLAGEAPFRVTFNDPGEIWWALYRMLYDWSIANDGLWWAMPEPDSGFVDDMYDWWTHTQEQGDFHGAILSESTGEETVFLYSAGWTSSSNALAHGGAIEQTSTQGAIARVVVVGVWASLYFKTSSSGWIMRVKIDGVSQFETINQYSTGDVWQVGYKFKLGAYGVHLLEFEFDNGGNGSNVGNIDYIGVSKLKNGGVVNAQYLTQAMADLLYSALGHEHKQILLLPAHGLNGTIGAGLTRSVPFFYYGLQTARFNFTVDRAGTLRKFSVWNNSAQPASGTLVVTLMHNNVASALTVTFSSTDGVAYKQDNAHSVTCVAGDVVSVDAVNNASVASAQINGITVAFELDTTG